MYICILFFYITILVGLFVLCCFRLTYTRLWQELLEACWRWITLNRCHYTSSTHWLHGHGYLETLATWRTNWLLVLGHGYLDTLHGYLDSSTTRHAAYFTVGPDTCSHSSRFLSRARFSALKLAINDLFIYIKRKSYTCYIHLFLVHDRLRTGAWVSRLDLPLEDFMVIDLLHREFGLILVALCRPNHLM